MFNSVEDFAPAKPSVGTTSTTSPTTSGGHFSSVDDFAPKATTFTSVDDFAPNAPVKNPPVTSTTLPTTLDMSKIGQVNLANMPIQMTPGHVDMKPFIQMQGQILDTQNKELKNTSDQIDSLKSWLDTNKDTLDEKTYNQNVDTYNTLINDYKSKVDPYNKSVIDYTKKIDAYNADLGKGDIYTVPLKNQSTTSADSTTALPNANSADASNNLVQNIISLPSAIIKQEFNPDVEQQDLEKQLPGGAYNAVPSFLYKAVSRFFSPMFRGYADDVAQNIAAGEAYDKYAQPGGPLTVEDIQKLYPATQKSGLQIAGDIAQTALAIYSPSIFGKTASIAMNSGVGDAFIYGAEHGAITGLGFGIAQAMSSGSSDVFENMKTIFTTTLGLSLLGGLTSSVVPFSKTSLDKLTKDVITEYKLPQRVYIDAEKIKSIFQTGEKISPEELKLVSSLGLSGDEYRNAIQNGLAIEIPTEKIVTIMDKPYWAKIKGFFGLEPTLDKQVISTAKPEVGPRAYLEAGKPEETVPVETKPTEETKPTTKIGDEVKIVNNKTGETHIGIVNKVDLADTKNKIGQTNPAGIAADLTDPLLFGNKMAFKDYTITPYKLTPEEKIQIQKVKDEQNLTHADTVDTIQPGRTETIAKAQEYYDEFGKTKQGKMFIQYGKEFPKEIESIKEGKNIIASAENNNYKLYITTYKGGAADMPKIFVENKKTGEIIQEMFWMKQPEDAFGLTKEEWNLLPESIQAKKEAQYKIDKFYNDDKSFEEYKKHTDFKIELAKIANKPTQKEIVKQTVKETPKSIKPKLKKSIPEGKTFTVKPAEEVTAIGEGKDIRFVPEQLVSKTEIKGMLQGLGKENVNLEVVNRNGKKMLHYEDSNTDFDLKPSALGLIDNNLKTGDVVKIDTQDLKQKGKAFRLYDENNLQAGMINPGAVVESIRDTVAKTSKYITETNEAVTFAKNLDDTLYKGTKNAEADTIENHQLLEETAKTISKEERANILDYRDKKEAGLTPPELTDKEQQINDYLIDPLYEDAVKKVEYMRKSGVPFVYDENYSHRLVKGKGDMLDKIVSQKNKIFPQGGTPSSKNILKKSAPALKHREMFAATNALTGERIVIHKPSSKEGNITGFKNKQPIDLGTRKQKITPRTKEFFDEKIQPIIDQVVENLGATHVVANLRGNKAGVTQGRNITTHPGVPERVDIHELGHVADNVYGMQEIFKKDDARNYGRDTMQDELRAVADLAAGQDPTLSHKRYTRKGAEKMAQMFEAYLYVPEQFQEVAPNLYEKFDEFLKNNDALAPLRDISEQASLGLGMKKFGGQHVAGIKGNTFVSNTGDVYKIGQATTAEIEQHTNVGYYHDPIIAAVFAHDDITRAFRAVQILENLKNNPFFIKNSFKAGEGLPPEGWKTTNLDQFRGYFFEPHTANVLNAFAQDLKSGDDPIKVLTSINNFFVSTMFLSPVKHLLNVGTSAIINRGATRWLNPMAYPVLAKTVIQSIRSIVTQDADYIKILRAGGPMMAARVDRDAYRASVLANLGEKTELTKDIIRKGIKIAGNFTPFKWTHALTWPGNDMIIQQQIREELAKQGLTVQQATIPQIEAVIREVTKLLPSYRLPVGVRRVPTYVRRNTLLFASYRYNLAKSFFELGKTLLTGESEGRLGSDSWKNRAEAVNKILVMAFLTMIAVPYINKKLKELTGNINTYLSSPGQISMIDNANKLATGQIDFTQYIQTMIDLPPGTKEFLQQFMTGTDWFTDKQIVSKGATAWQEVQQRIAHAENVITPYDLTQKISGGKMTVGELLMAQLGIHSPTGNHLLNILNGSSGKVIDEITRLNATALPPTMTDVEARPDVKIFKSQITPEKYDEAMKQFTSTFVANVAKLMDDQYRKPATNTSMAKILKYTQATDAQKSAMIDEVKNETLATVEKAYNYKKGGVTGKAVFEGQTTTYGFPTKEVLSSASPDDGKVVGKNPKGEPYYERPAVAITDAIRDKLYDSDPYWKDNGYNKSDVQLDHIVPFEAGGNMNKNNMMLISKLSDQLNQPFEDYIGEKYKAGTISRADAIRASVDYKINKSVSLTDIKNGKY